MILYKNKFRTTYLCFTSSFNVSIKIMILKQINFKKLVQNSIVRIFNFFGNFQMKNVQIIVGCKINDKT